jgi:cysteine synthase
MKAQTILGAIGNTPHIKINHLFASRVELWMKAERSNPAASIKDRCVCRDLIVSLKRLL